MPGFESVDLLWPLLAAVSIACLVIALNRPAVRRWRRPFRPYVVRSNRDAQAPARPEPRPVIDGADQLREVMNATFEPVKIMSLGEFKVFREVEAEIAARGDGFRVFAQPSLGEVIRSANPRAHAAINSKRVDILIVRPNGMPLLAIEHQGAGHYQGQAAARDAVKKEALRRAGVMYLEFFDADPAETVRARVREALDKSLAPA